MLILAPMQGLTEVLFRKSYERCFPHAFDYAVSPFLSLTHGNLADAWKKIDDVLPENNEGAMPVVPQLLGKEPEEFVGLANRLGEIGFNEVNWNIGCPMRRVAAKHRGSGILPYPDEVQHILDAVVPQLKVRLSVKMRLGLTNPDEIFRLIPVLNNYPLASVTIHPRIGRQQYAGTVDQERFGQALTLLNTKVIYNGDICTVADYRHLRHRFPQVVDVMIGRGVLYNPLLPLQIKADMDGNSQPDYTHAVRFIDTLTTAILQRPVAETAKMRKIKEYWCLLRKSLPITEQQSLAVLHTSTLEETLSNLNRLTHKDFTT